MFLQRSDFSEPLVRHYRANSNLTDRFPEKGRLPSFRLNHREPKVGPGQRKRNGGRTAAGANVKPCRNGKIKKKGHSGKRLYEKPVNCRALELFKRKRRQIHSLVPTDQHRIEP